jgi:pimeloyl-ACP methyl ester carboxylesterase
MALEAAEKYGDKKAYSQLKKMGLPKGKRGKDCLRFFSYFYPLMERDMDSYEDREIKPFLESDEYSRLEKRSMDAWGRLYLKVINNILSVSLLNENLHFECPYYIVGGKKDYITPFELDEGYLEKVDAPKKELIVFPNCGHISAFENPKRFMKELRKRLR